MRRASRLFRYITMMFPPGSHFPQAVALFAGIYCSLQAVSGIEPLQFGWRTAFGAGSVVMALLLVRLYDDVRDAPADIRLARAGDPRYLNRPTVTGLVSLVEVRWLAATLSMLLVVLHLAWGGPRTRLVLLAGFAITWLAFHWFFLPSLAGKPAIVATLARKSLTIVVAGYVVAAFADEWNRMELPTSAWLLAAAPCFEAAAWEVSRKIRVPADETDYGTYSKLIGARGAAGLAVCFAILALLCLVRVARAAGLGWAYPTLLLSAVLVMTVAAARFIREPTRARSNPRPYAELFGAVANGGLVAALCLRYGVAIR